MYCLSFLLRPGVFDSRYIVDLCATGILLFGGDSHLTKYVVVWLLGSHCLKPNHTCICLKTQCGTQEALDSPKQKLINVVPLKLPLWEATFKGKPMFEALEPYLRLCCCFK